MREELGVPPYATSIPCALWPDSPPKSRRAPKRSGQRQMERGGSLPGP